MKAVVFDHNGGPEVFRWAEVETPTCGPTDVLIRNAFISIEGGDLISREIVPPPNVPHVVGYQSAGEIVAIGSDVTDRSVGQKVVTIVAAGSHAEYVRAPADMTWLVPDGLGLDAAAAIPVVFGTAHECLFEFGHLEQGQSVLIHAGAGALGLAAIQLAKRAGARVLTTASDDAKLARLRDLGADVTINYTTQDFVEAVLDATNGKGVDLVVDSVAGSTLGRSIQCLRYRGQVIMVGVSGRDPERLDPLALWPGAASVQGIYYPAIFAMEHDRCFAAVKDLIDEIADGRLKVVIDRVFPLHEATLAHRFVLERKAFGRVLLQP